MLTETLFEMTELGMNPSTESGEGAMREGVGMIGWAHFEHRLDPLESQTLY